MTTDTETPVTDKLWLAAWRRVVRKRGLLRRLAARLRYHFRRP